MKSTFQNNLFALTAQLSTSPLRRCINMNACHSKIGQSTTDTITITTNQTPEKYPNIYKCEVSDKFKEQVLILYDL